MMIDTLSENMVEVSHAFSIVFLVVVVLSEILQDRRYVCLGSFSCGSSQLMMFASAM